MTAEPISIGDTIALFSEDHFGYVFSYQSRYLFHDKNKYNLIYKLTNFSHLDLPRLHYLTYSLYSNSNLKYIYIIYIK